MMAPTRIVGQQRLQVNHQQRLDTRGERDAVRRRLARDRCRNSGVPQTTQQRLQEYRQQRLDTRGERDAVRRRLAHDRCRNSGGRPQGLRQRLQVSTWMVSGRRQLRQQAPLEDRLQLLPKPQFLPQGLQLRPRKIYQQKLDMRRGLQDVSKAAADSARATGGSPSIVAKAAGRAAGLAAAAAG